MYQECHGLGKMRFEFQDRASAVGTCSTLAARLQIMEDSNMDQLLRSRYVADEFDHAKVRRVADELCKPDQVNIFLRSKDFADDVTETDEWFQTKYSVEPFSEQLLKAITEPHPELNTKKLDLPPPNNLIPKKYDVLDANEEYSAAPQLLKQWDDTDLWYKKDDKFGRPKAQVALKIYTADCNFGFTAQSRVFVKVWRAVLGEHLREFNYMAECANLTFKATLLYDNIDVSWGGFDDSMPSYIPESIQKILEMRTADLREFFDQAKEKLLLEWKNAYLGQSYLQALDLFDSLTLESAVEKRTLRRLLEAYSYEQFSGDLQGWLQSGRFVWYICGNYGHTEAIELVEKARSLFGGQQTPAIEDLAEVRPTAVQEGTSYLLEAPHQDESNGDSCIITYYETGHPPDGDFTLSLTNQVVMQYLNEPFFDDLRTKQQLGYVVVARHITTRGVVGCQFLVQSPKRSCEYLIDAVNCFLVRVQKQVAKITEEDFEVQKQAVHTKLAVKDLSLAYEKARHWGSIAEHKYVFDSRERELAALGEITREQFIEHFEKIFFSAKAKRIDVSLTSAAHRDEQEQYRISNSHHEIFKK